jgi:hypothetical protein
MCGQSACVHCIHPLARVCSFSRARTLQTLYTYGSNPRAYKALIAAEYAGLEINVPSDFQMGVTNRTAEFLQDFPLGKVPAFKTADGHAIVESNAIAFYGTRATPLPCSSLCLSVSVSVCLSVCLSPPPTMD